MLIKLLSLFPNWPGLFIIGIMIFMIDVKADDSSLQVLIRGNENSGIVFGNDMHNNFHVILRTKDKPVRVFQTSNSWGWQTRLFTAVDRYDSNKKYRIIRNPRPWYKNVPSTHEIKAGNLLITDINLIDGSWKVEPPLEEGRAHRLLLTAHFNLDVSSEAKIQKVWIGKISSSSEESVLQQEVIPILNGTKKSKK